MNYSLATGLSVHQTVALIMSAKPLDVIVGQLTTEFMDRMTEQMAQMVAPVKTTTWGGLHGSLALVLNDADYAAVTRNIITCGGAGVCCKGTHPYPGQTGPSRPTMHGT